MELTFWYRCPWCGANVQKLRRESTIRGVPLYCKRCRQESEPHFEHGVFVPPEGGADGKRQHHTD